MQHLFSPGGLAALQTLAQTQPLLAFDFDGTLAPIVTRPEDARVPTPLALRLARLAQRAPVAVITGRRCADVQDRLGFTPRCLIGNHGAERQGAGPFAPSHALHRMRLALVTRQAWFSAAQVQIEDKGWSLALHYRLAHDRQRALAVIDEALRDLDPGLSRFGGKCVVNLVPAQSPDKGDAVAALLAETASGAALFVGDDLNDEAVFRRATPHWLTVRIGRDDPRSQARYFLDTQAEMTLLLDRLLASLPIHRQSPGPTTAAP